MSETKNRYNRLINPKDFESDEFIGYMQKASGRKVIPFHRKYWEWGMAYRVLEERGYLNRETTALGLGTGYEPFAFILSEFVKESIRTDYVDEKSLYERICRRGLNNWLAPQFSS